MFDSIYFLESEIQNSEAIRGIYGFIGKELKSVTFQNQVDGYFIKWYLSSFTSCIIEDKSQLLNEFFEKDEAYRGSSPALKKLYKFQKTSIVPGQYYQRVFRPILSPRSFRNSIDFANSNRVDDLEIELKQLKDFFPFDQQQLLVGVNQLSLLTDLLKSIFKVIYPSKENLMAFGNEIRNLHILCCTEVEAQLKGIYFANYQASKNVTRTNDYVKLKKFLKLDEYSVQLGLYPWLPDLKPFENWNQTNPTKSIAWYDDYNAIKHDRENEFHKGNIQNVLFSISALAILLYAQYGENMPYWNDLIGGYIRFAVKPNWQFLDHYLPPLKGNNWAPKKNRL